MAKAVKLNGLKKIVPYLSKIEDECAESLAHEIAEEAETSFHEAEYAGPEIHKSEINVTAKKEENGKWTVTASGKAVAFIEFGAGALAEGSYDGTVPPFYDYGASPAGRPSHPEDKDFWFFRNTDGGLEDNDYVSNAYRETRARRYDENGDFLEYKEGTGTKFVEGLWFTYGNDANNCLFSALENARENAADMIREAREK